MKKKNKVNLKKVVKAKGGQDLGAGATGMGSGNTGNTGNTGSDHSHSRFSPGSGYYGESRTTKGGAGDTKTNRPPNDPKDVPFEKPLPNVGPLSVAINLATYANYKGRQKFSRQKGLYRDHYKTTGKSLQPNSPQGKAYVKDAGYGKRTEDKPDRGMDPKPKKIIPPVTTAAKPAVARQPVMPYYMGFDFQKAKSFKRGGLSGGKRFGPPPKKGPNSHGKCPFRPDGIKGVGAVQKGRGVKFVGVK